MTDDNRIPISASGVLTLRSLLRFFLCMVVVFLVSSCNQSPTTVTEPPVNILAWRQTRGPYGGTASAIVRSSTGAIYAGSTTGGVYKTTNEGDSWTCVGLSGRSINRLVIDPSGVVYAAGEGNGVLERSANEGTSWTDLIVPGMRSIEAILADSIGRLFVAGYDGLSESVDSGNTWTKLNGITGGVEMTGVVRKDGSELIAASRTNGVFRSTDGGQNWAPVNSLAGIRSLAVSSRGFLAAASDRDVYVSTDAGMGWRSSIPDPSAAGITAMACDSNGTLLVAARRGAMGTVDVLYSSVDSAGHWSQYETTRSPILSLAFAGNRMYFGTTDDGIFLKQGTGSLSRQIGFPKTIVTSLAQNASGTIFANERSGIYRSSDGGASWVKVYQSSREDDGERSIAVLSSGTVIAGTADSTLVRSTDGGTAWNRVVQFPAGVVFTDFAELSAGRILAYDLEPGGGRSLYRSQDDGITWSFLNPPGSFELRRLLAAPGGNLFCIVDGARFLRSTNAGDSWIEVDSTRHSQFITSLTLKNGGQPVISAMSQTGDGTDVRIYTPGSPAWRSVTRNSPDLIVLLGSDRRGNLIGATDMFSIIVSPDNGVSWEPTDAGLVFISVSAFLPGNDGYVYAASRGDGVFRISLP